MAIAVTVSVDAMVNGPVYWVEEVVGAEPLVV
jgi:hypothetical protein